VVVGEVAGERLLQQADLGSHAAPGQLRQHLRVTLAGDQRGQHVASGHAEDVRGDHAEFDLRVFEELLHPLLLRRADPDQVGPVAGQIPQHADRRRWDEAGADHLPLGDLAQPHRVELVGLGASRQVFDIFGVDQPGVEAVGLQQIEHRLPVIRGCLHDHSADP
jgi:hypothetical protein